MNPAHVSCLEDVHQLRIFRTVAENLSFTRAAEALFLTQSAVSHQIANLEGALGTELLRRSGRSVSLTPAGAVLQQQLRRVFAVIDEAEAAVRLASRPGAGRLRVGASATACQHLIPEALREFRESFPAHSLSIKPGDSIQISDELMEGTIDLGILIRTDRRPKFRYHDLFSDELGFLVSPLHPWAKANRVERRDFPAQRMVLYSHNSATFRMVERYFLKMQSPLRDWMELGSMEAIKELVKLGLGVSVMAKWIVRPELDAKSLVWLPMPGIKLRRSWCIASLATRDLSVAEQTFISLCQAAGAQIVAD
jgi:LysR family transcriptional regulator, low CO2-responsive transcriptional regulator